MKTTTTLAKRAALITVLMLGANAWVGAQTNQAHIGRLDGRPVRLQEKKTADLSTNSQYLQPMKINKASSLIGSTVMNQRGEALGKIRDLVIDFNTDRVAYVVLDSDMRRPHPGMDSEPTEVMARPADGTGGIVPLVLYPPGYDLSSLFIYDPAVSRWVRGGSSVTGIVSSSKLHAVPLRAFQPDFAGTALILNTDKDKFTRSEGFDQNNWPAVTTTVWGAEPLGKSSQVTSGSPERHDLEQQNTKHRQNTNTTIAPLNVEPRP